MLIADDDVTVFVMQPKTVTIVVMTAAGLALAAQNLDTVVALFGFLFKYLYASHAYHLNR